MSELPPNIDAILASIRARMSADGDVRAADTPVAFAPPIESEPGTALGISTAPATGIGTVTMAEPAMTLDALMRSMLEPMLQTWLDTNMPEIVERMAQAEIKRLTGKV